ncbi:putative Polycomb group protein ASXL2 isoform X2 [Boleophthalmus pectinirostris]|uniref:putative Polycomb group protein ASXL2 isoform X2 n=1 Tax=Boleophthalmus pectinirostris TaxID=150288 RepID=UPI000A1C5BA4|nr:putative Polycomb group protein ASXL2 isoform X2 [Boleophthalmus pectinirostris]
MRERQRKKKGRTWAEAAKTVLEKYPNTPMSHKEILQVIQRERLKEISGTSPLACLNAMLHTNSRGEEGIFYKVPGRMGVYTLKKDSGDTVKDLSEDGSEESSSDTLSDSRSTENSISPEQRRGRWMRRVPSKLQSQPSSPQPRCSSPSVPTAKLLSPSQKHSKKALKQALKQQRNQRRQGAMGSASSPRLLLKTIKDITMADNISTKADLRHSVGARKVSQRRLSAGQIKRTKCNIDVETPDSILVNTNLRALINKHTFSVLPPDCQQRLLRLLPEVDRQACMDGLLKVTSSALNNEFFTSAAQSWKERLAEGEFTPELQLRMRQEIEKEKKMESWKEAFFENYYGENSGLSFEESKELTKVDQNLKTSKTQSPLPPPLPPPPPTPSTEPTIAKSPQTKSGDTKDNDEKKKPESASSAAAKDIKPPSKPSQELPKPPLPVLEPMRTRRAQQAEDRKASIAAQSASLNKTVTEEAKTSKEVEKVTQSEEKKAEPPPPQLVSPIKEPPKLIQDIKKDAKLSQDGKKHEKIVSVKESAMLNEEAKTDQNVLSLIKEPTELSQEVKTDQKSVLEKEEITKIIQEVKKDDPVSVERVIEQKEEVLGSADGCKRKSLSETDSDVSPEKRQRLSSFSSVSSVSSVSPPPTSSISSPATPSPSSQRVPPLKIHKSRIHPVPVSPGQPSPRAPLPAPLSSPGRTGARTLADIKAKAQLARAQRAAMAAAARTGTQPVNSGASLDQPSPTPSPSPTSPQAPVKIPHTNITPPSRSFEVKTSPSPTQISIKVEQKASPVSVPCSSSLEQNMTAISKEQSQVSPVGTSRNTSCIPANNPLVTKLLQGKEVPMEQILPKPLSKVEVKMAVKSTGTKAKGTPLVSGNNVENKSAIGRQEFKHHKELPDKETQEQILQALMQRKTQQNQQFGGLGSQHLKATQMEHAEEKLTKIGVGFLGCKRKQKPAMTGHYLLNVSTYGRGSDRQKQQAISNKLKREIGEAEGVGRTLSGVKTERKTEELLCVRIKNEPGFEDSDKNNNSSGIAKDSTSPQQKHLNFSNNAGSSEPYLSHQQGFHKDNQQAAYSGSYSMTLNNNKDSVLDSNSSNYSETDSGQHGSVMSFSVTVTTIPAGRSMDSSQGEPSPEQSYIDGPNMEDVQSKCYCRLKAMIMCKGCGAFCHDDCIGPSKLCVSCLVVR